MKKSLFFCFSMSPDVVVVVVVVSFLPLSQIAVSFSLFFSPRLSPSMPRLPSRIGRARPLMGAKTRRDQSDYEKKKERESSSSTLDVEKEKQSERIARERRHPFAQPLNLSTYPPFLLLSPS